MVKKGDAYAVGSQDYDCLLVGAPILVRNLTSQGKRKLPGKKAYLKIYPKQINLKINLKNLGIKHKQLVDIAILIGTDFNDGVLGIGPKKSLQLIKKNGDIRKVLNMIDVKNPPSPDEIKEIRKIFLEPKITDEYKLQWPGIHKDKVLKILCDQHNFKKERVELTITKFANIQHMIKQKTLF
jgi:flap endonuclease-1